MNQHDFRTLLAAGAVDRVILHRRIEGGGYELWAFSDEDLWPAHLGNRLRVARPDHRPGTPPERTWSNVGTAIQWVRKMGWKGTIEVEEPVIQDATPDPYDIFEDEPPAGAYQV